jgi:uncharacterized protein YjbJ (UPF0337 family)
VITENEGNKKLVGRAVAGDRVRTGGRVDRAKGNIKQSGAKVKDAFKY